MMLTVEALPLMLNLDDRSRLAIYDGARTGLADELRRLDTVQVLEMRTEADLVAAAQEASGPLTAVSLPPDWAETDEPLTVTGYYGHWLPPAAQAQLAAEMGQQLTAVSQRPIRVQPHTVYPTLENRGHSLMVALGWCWPSCALPPSLFPTSF